MGVMLADGKALLYIYTKAADGSDETHEIDLIVDAHIAPSLLETLRKHSNAVAMQALFKNGEVLEFHRMK